MEVGTFVGDGSFVETVAVVVEVEVVYAAFEEADFGGPDCTDHYVVGAFGLDEALEDSGG